MRNPQSQLWGTLFLIGTLAAVSCTNDGKTEGPLGGPDTPIAPGDDSPVPTPPSKVDPTPGVNNQPPSQGETPKPGEQTPSRAMMVAI